MSKFKYAIKVLEFTEIHEMPVAWTSEHLIGLLNHLEYEDVKSIAEDELRDMCAMALSDFEVVDAAIRVLEYRLGDRLNSGQRQNLSEALQEDRIWEEYSDLSFHEELFNATCMLYWAFPKQFSTPDIVKISLQVTAMNKDSISNLEQPTPSFLCRILNDGMDEHTIMQRLLGDNLNSNSFPEAEHIIWSFEAKGMEEGSSSNTFTIYTSWNWVEDLRGVLNYESFAFSDGQLK
jgi:hypothetical protein